MSGVTIQGLERFRGDLEKLDLSKQKDLLVETGLEAVEPLRLEIAAEAPVRTGRLSRSIEKQENRAESTVDSVTIDVGPSIQAFYGIFQEFGTAFQPPQEFVEPAIEASLHEVENGMVNGMNRLLDRI